MGGRRSTSRFRALVVGGGIAAVVVEGRLGMLDFFLGVVSRCEASTSINLPPPPGPPGTYLRFLKGGPSGESAMLRELFKADLG
jgi:hypothetical protein